MRALALGGCPVFKSEGDWADPAALKKLVLTDSAIRESIRRSSIRTRGLLLAVASPNGLTLPNGTRVPQGTWLGVPVQAVHTGEDLSNEPYEYNPFRFAKIRSASYEKVDATDISDTLLGWSYGRYAWSVHFSHVFDGTPSHCSEKEIKIADRLQSRLLVRRS